MWSTWFELILPSLRAVAYNFNFLFLYTPSNLLLYSPWKLYLHPYFNIYLNTPSNLYQNSSSNLSLLTQIIYSFTVQVIGIVKISQCIFTVNSFKIFEEVFFLLITSYFFILPLIFDVNSMTTHKFLIIFFSMSFWIRNKNFVLAHNNHETNADVL